MDIIGYLALIGIGVVLSMIGGGGSLLSLPVMVYIFSLDIVTATSYSLFVVGATSLYGAWQRHQQINLQAAVLFCLSSAAAIFMTRKWIFPEIPDVMSFDHLTITKRSVVLAVFSLLAMLSAILVLYRRQLPEPEGKVRIPVLILVSFSTGIVAGMIGIGGGFIILPALIIFTRLDFRSAVGTSLFVIGCNSLAGFAGDLLNREVDWLFLFLITFLSISGMTVGNRYNHHIPMRMLREFFGWFMIAISAGILIRELS